MNAVDLSKLEVLNYPPLTADVEEAMRHVDEYGMCLLKDVLPEAELDVIEARLKEQAECEMNIAAVSQSFVESQNLDTASAFVWNLVNKGECFQPLIDHPLILQMVRYVLGEHVLLCSMGAHMNGSDRKRLLPLHQDQWPMVPYAMPAAVLCNVLLLISDNTVENGGTRMIPGSQEWPTVDYEQMNTASGWEKTKPLNAPRGTAIVYDGRIWHAPGVNTTSSVRTNLAIAYVQPWLRPQENHPYTILPEVFSRLTREQKDIIGCRSYGTLGGHDGSSITDIPFDRDRVAVGELHRA